MSWSSGIRLLAVLAVTAVLPALSACSGFRPVYGESFATAGRYSFDYAEPGSRLDQVIYTELRLRLGPESDAINAIDVAVSATASSRAITRTAVTKPAATHEMTVSASVVATGPDGAVVFTGTRTAGALYTTSGQALADAAAQTDASERAARALADTIRLAIIGALEAGPGA
jgi:hypothetical protein